MQQFKTIEVFQSMGGFWSYNTARAHGFGYATAIAAYHAALAAVNANKKMEA